MKFALRLLFLVPTGQHLLVSGKRLSVPKGKQKHEEDTGGLRTSHEKKAGIHKKKVDVYEKHTNIDKSPFSAIEDDMNATFQELSVGDSLMNITASSKEFYPMKRGKGSKGGSKVIIKGSSKGSSKGGDGPKLCRRPERDPNAYLKVLAPLESDRFQMDCLIPPVLHDDHGGHTEEYFEVGLRQFDGQVFPDDCPKTTLWGYGDPKYPHSFSNPAGTIEVTVDCPTKIKWINELVKDPTQCREEIKEYGNGYSDACNSLEHLIRYADGSPGVDTQFHWAAPDQLCENMTATSKPPVKTDCHGMRSTDCRQTPPGLTCKTRKYYGAVPMVVHLHGGHTDPESDGFPEAWYLPKANNIPESFARHGSTFASQPEKDGYVTKGDEGYALFEYRNDQETSTIWYHDHTLGLTAWNAQVAGAGFYLIRTKDDGEKELEKQTCLAQEAKLPGPPPRKGMDPNTEEQRKIIREIPLAINPNAFWDDYSLTYAEFNNPLYNPNFILVNGRMWPNLRVASERYRFRLLAAFPLNHFDYKISLSKSDGTQLPFYVIGSDQGMVPHVVKLSKDGAQVFTHKSGCGSYEEFDYPTEGNLEYFKGGLPMGSGERYDIIVDFGGLEDGDIITMDNAFTSPPGYLNPDDPGSELTDKFMRFVVDKSLNNPHGEQSSNPEQLVINPAKVPDGIGPPTIYNVTLQVLDTYSAKGFPKYSPVFAGGVPGKEAVSFFLGVDGQKGKPSMGTPAPCSAIPQSAGNCVPYNGGDTLESWSTPISINPRLFTQEIWRFWDWSILGHPMHIHQVKFQVTGRYDRYLNKYENGVFPWEKGLKDMVISRSGKTDGILFPNDNAPFNILNGDGQVTEVKMYWDIPGLYVYHCHILAHEDNEMMRPICIGEPGSKHCPAKWFTDHHP